MRNNSYRYLIIAGFLVVCCLSLTIIYPIYIGTTISHSSNDWANLGKYLGGVIGPVLSLWLLLGLCFLLRINDMPIKKTGI